MKRILAIVILSVIAGFCPALAQPAKGDSPEKVYQMFIDAVHREDVDMVLACGTKKPGENRKVIERSLPFLKLSTPFRFRPTEQRISGDRCVIVAKGFFTLPGLANLTESPKDPEEWSWVTIVLVKEKKVWKVDEQEITEKGKSPPKATDRMFW